MFVLFIGEIPLKEISSINSKSGFDWLIISSIVNLNGSDTFNFWEFFSLKLSNSDLIDWKSSSFSICFLISLIILSKSRLKDFSKSFTKDLNLLITIFSDNALMTSILKMN